MAAFVVNHALQEDVLSGIPLVFIFGLFLLCRPFPSQKIMRLLTYYSAFSLIFRESFRLAAAASFTFEQSYNTSQSYAICSNQLVILNSTRYDDLSTSKYISFTTVGSFSEVFVMMAIQLHMSVMRARGINQHIDQYTFHSFLLFLACADAPQVAARSFCIVEERGLYIPFMQLLISLSCLARRPVCVLTLFFSAGAHLSSRIAAQSSECSFGQRITPWFFP